MSFFESATLTLTTRAKAYNTNAPYASVPDKPSAAGASSCRRHTATTTSEVCPQHCVGALITEYGQQLLRSPTPAPYPGFGLGAANVGNNQWHHTSDWEKPPMGWGTVEVSATVANHLNAFAQVVLVVSRCGFTPRRAWTKAGIDTHAAFQTTAGRSTSLRFAHPISCVI